MQNVWDVVEMHLLFWWEEVKKAEHLKQLIVDGRILKWLLK